MKDISQLSFFRLIVKLSKPDVFFTEFLRVHPSSIIDENFQGMLEGNDTGIPIVAQVIGESIPDLKRIAQELEKFPIAGVDFNLGCPAPKIYKKNVGGGLLRDLKKTTEILGALRDAIGKAFLIKTRTGFDNTSHFSKILETLDSAQPDCVSIHGRTVKELYFGQVRYDLISQAVKQLHCPVIANGNISSANKALSVLQETKAAGIMIGRGALRNPWIFRQIREALNNEPVFQPKFEDARYYIQLLYEMVINPNANDEKRAGCMKRYLNFVAQSVDPNGLFLRAMRLASSTKELLLVCDEFLIKGPNASQLLSDEPYPQVIARPNCEG